MDVQLHDFLTIGLLVVLEGLLSADNALVLAMLVLGLPRADQRKALRYGIIGAFAFRIAADAPRRESDPGRGGSSCSARCTCCISRSSTSLRRTRKAERRRSSRRGRGWASRAFWATVVKVELTDIVFAVDSILVAVAMSPKTWVVISGGVLGIVTMRVVIGQLLTLVRRYPALVDGAFVIIAWVGLKLLLEYLRADEWIHFEISKWISFGLIVGHLPDLVHLRAPAGPRRYERRRRGGAVA